MRYTILIVVITNLKNQAAILQRVYLIEIIWDKVFKNGPSKICGRQPLKNLKGYGLLRKGNMILKKMYFPSTSRFFKLSHEKSLISILYNKKSVSNFNFSLISFGKIKLL